MNPTKNVLSNSVDAKANQKRSLEKTSTEKSTLGQRLADSMAAEVGSWRFLISQSAVLAGWVGLNMMPGVPHWDQSPFMMLNLVFSFASAYTAPIVLMSQNRQSDIDRKNDKLDHQVNLRAGQNIELLHEKLDNLHSEQLKELTQIVKQQQQIINELKVTLVSKSDDTKEVKMNVVPGLNVQLNGKFSKESSSNKPFTLEQAIGDNAKVVEKLTHR
ncbi:DUF1003 domain-containing protein [Hassallia byssoidea VB512170]|uniref:DUF1003 domain-containing protein n=1 Tax=Hassallia byssoidea VB512170 TaxID=1304833 RepID=A0A846HBX8_9CYAN|nr:DUF1003 domain-containing protein [Hassalia byssoidea]NEU75097.1 DUF1003 domain-containing protein [Hassalia byssoidea VB512170]